MKTVDLYLDDQAEKTIEVLRQQLGVDTEAMVFKRALQLINTVMASEDRAMVVRLPEGLIRVHLF